MAELRSERGAHDGPSTSVLALEHLSVSFGGIRVVRDVALELRAGEMVGLAGHNGSGKSTIVKVLAGFYDPESGSTLRIHDEPVALPMAADTQITHGIAIVHQDLALVERGTVWENIGFGGFAVSSLGVVHGGQERARSRAMLETLGSYVSPDAVIEDLAPSDRACVAIARAFRRIETSASPCALILDEATTFFDKQDAAAFLLRVREIAQRAEIGVLVIGHRLDELLTACHRVIVLRDGVVVAARSTDELNEQQLVTLMLGEDAPNLDRSTEPGEGLALSSIEGSEVSLRVRGLRSRADFEACADLSVRAGEVVGLAGLRGDGCDDVIKVVAGDASGVSGTIEINGRAVQARQVTTYRMKRLGVGYVPAQQARAAVFELRASENLFLPWMRNFVTRGWLRTRLLRSEARRRFGLATVLPNDPDKQFGLFSGGNRQKVIVARWADPSVRVLALDEPMQGIDVRARRELTERLRDAATNGVAVLVASQDARDLAALCDRVLVMRDGGVRSELVGDEVTAGAISAACY